MNILILAAGYATRLYPLTLNTPKPLLKLGERLIIDYIIDKIEGLAGVNQVYLVSNDKFYPQFQTWLSAKSSNTTYQIKLINDGSLQVEDRLGAIGDIGLTIARENINDDLLIIAGDNLFEFDLQDFIRFAQSKKPYHSLCLHLAHTKIDLTRFGIAQLGQDAQITGFEEKPLEPKSNLIATCIYFFPKEKLHFVPLYLNNGHHNDAPGSYIRWLTQHDKVFGEIFDSAWFDLGDSHSLKQAENHLALSLQKIQ